MKKIIMLGAIMALISGCASTQPAQTTETTPKLGMPNPASAYCIEQGGKLEIRNEANGQVGYCHLPSGDVVEEWAYFRSQQQVCVEDAVQNLVGQSLSEAEIKEITKATTVRMMKPGQPMTMDYRADRVTVTIDPTTKKISHASCG